MHDLEIGKSYPIRFRFYPYNGRCHLTQQVIDFNAYMTECFVRIFKSGFRFCISAAGLFAGIPAVHGCALNSTILHGYTIWIQKWTSKSHMQCNAERLWQKFGVETLNIDTDLVSQLNPQEPIAGGCTLHFTILFNAYDVTETLTIPHCCNCIIQKRMWQKAFFIKS